MPLVAIHIRWDDTRLSSTISMRIQSRPGRHLDPEQRLDRQREAPARCGSGAR